jgi:hypothetical protein
VCRFFFFFFFDQRSLLEKSAKAVVQRKVIATMKRLQRADALFVHSNRSQSRVKKTKAAQKSQQDEKQSDHSNAHE